MTHPIEKLWREVGLPEYFLGNDGSNERLYALYRAIVEQCAKHIEHDADVASNSLHCGDNHMTIAAVHRVSRAYYEAAKSIRGLAVASHNRETP